MHGPLDRPVVDPGHVITKFDDDWIILIFLRLPPCLSQRLPRLGVLHGEAEMAAIDEEDHELGEVTEWAGERRRTMLRRDGLSTVVNGVTLVGWSHRQG
jgi:hypothetical protein